MEVWARWNRQIKNCAYDTCQTQIFKGDPVIVGRSRRSTKAGPRTKLLSFHPECWLAQAMDHLHSIPEGERIPTRGRRPMCIPPEIKAKRVALLRRHANITHRQKLYALRGDIERVAGLEFAKQELIPLIDALGGIPAKWAV